MLSRAKKLRELARYDAKSGRGYKVKEALDSVGAKQLPRDTQLALSLVYFMAHRTEEIGK